MASRTGAKARAAARKQKDKWKSKRWFTIRAPRNPWNYKKIGETIAEEEEYLIDRIYEMTQQEFDGDFSKMHVKLRFRVHQVVGQDALTEFIGHQHQADHVRRQVRRYRGKIDDSFDVVSTDGYLVRIKPLAITERRVKSSIKAAIRKKLRETIISYASRNTFSQIQKAILGNDIEAELKSKINPIYPVKSVVVRRSQLLQSGVVSDSGPTLDEIHSEEERTQAELAAKKAAALAAAGDEGSEEETVSPEADVLAAAEAMESLSEKPQQEESDDEKQQEAIHSSVDPPEDLSSLTVAELKVRLKEVGKPVSGKKAELIARLQA